MDHLTEQELSHRWLIPPETLRTWRARKQGPPYLKLEGKVRYRMADVEEYERSKLRKPLNQGAQHAAKTK